MNEIEGANRELKMLIGVDYVIILVTICIAYTHAQSICSSYTGSTVHFVPNPADCAFWMACSKGQIVNQGRCPDGYNFDSVMSICRAVGEANCNDMHSCATVPAGFFIPKEESCDEYYYCAQNGTAILGQCDKGLYFDAEKQKCEFSKNVMCKDEEDTSSSQFSIAPNPRKICVDTIEGDTKKIFASDPGDCSSYYYCPNGPKTTAASLVKGVCPDTKIFSETALKCVNNNLKNGVQCAKRLPCAGKPVGYFDIGYECNTFYYCGPKGKGKETSCPEGYDFDVVHQNCNKKGLFQCQKLAPTVKF